MSTQTNAMSSNNIPKIYERSEVIILSESLECPCGRTKERAHCPNCGRAKLYAMADTTVVKMPNGFDILKGCRIYRCEGCGTRFSDVGWYFNCAAPKKIDWTETKRLQKENEKKQLQDEWFKRIAAGEKFDFNTRTKCKAEAGFDPEEMRMLMQRAKTYKKPEETDQAKRNKAFDDHVVDCTMCNILPAGQYCEKAMKIKEGI